MKQLITIAFLIVIVISCCPGANSQFTVLKAVNAGGNALQASDGIHYQADKTGEKNCFLQNTKYPIDLTSPRDAGLFTNIRSHSEKFGYEFAVPQTGSFLLVLKWAEIDARIKANCRLIDVLLNGQHQVAKDFDVFKMAGGGFIAYFHYVYFSINNNQLTWNGETSTINDGVITLDFLRNKNNPFLSAFVLYEGNVATIPKLPWSISQEQNQCLQIVADYSNNNRVVYPLSKNPAMACTIKKRPAAST